MKPAAAIRVLLVEDSETDALLIREALADVTEFEHALVRAERLSDGLAQTQSTHFDVVLLDLGLPDARGLETVRKFLRLARDVPVLVLTGLDDVSVGLPAIQEGAQDFLLKKAIRASELGRAIRYAIERHRIAAALKASEERFQLAVSGATAGLWDWNPQTGAMYFSPQFKDILGYEDRELANDAQALRDAIHPDDVNYVIASLKAHLEHQGVYDVEYQVRTKSGNFRWIQSRGQALWNDAGEPYRMVGWIIDVTERKLADEALRASREELQRLSANIQHAREKEKNRIARELHDDLGQLLVALKMEAARIDDYVSGTETTTPLASMRNVDALIDELVDSVRRIAADLRPAMLDDLGLIPALDWLIERFSASHGIDVARRIGARNVDFNREGSTAVFRIVQEALTNVARHSGATSVTIDIARKGSDCVVRVADNGRGCAGDVRSSPEAFGLLGMRERAAQLGGTVEIGTAPGHGFALTVAFPLAAVKDAAEE